ncbi:hypothetical protein Tco_1408813 [Tanacetum coccineum]
MKCYWESMNDSKQEELEWENLSLNDLMKIRYGKVCMMTRERILKDHRRDRFGDEEDYLEENLEDPEECGEDKVNAIMRVIHDKLNDDWEPTPILMEKFKVTRYTIGPGEIYTKVNVLGVDEIPRTRDNVAAIRARLMEKMAHKGNGQAKT